MSTYILFPIHYWVIKIISIRHNSTFCDTSEHLRAQKTPPTSQPRAIKLSESNTNLQSKHSLAQLLARLG